MKNHHQPEFVYYGHHKCASSWINRFLWNVTLSMGMRFYSYHSDDQADGDIPGEVVRKKIEVVAFRNAHWDHARSFEGIPGIHVIRDPRDIIVSGYFSHLKTHRLLTDPELAAEREVLKTLSKEDGMVETMNGINGRTLREMGEWQYGQASNILEFRLEDMSKDPEKSLRSILLHAGWLVDCNGKARINEGAFWRAVNRVWRRSGERTLLRRRFDGISEKEFERISRLVSFQRLSGGRRPGETDTNSHYRKGVHGDWVNHFTPRIETEFKARFPGLVRDLGYEADEQWAGADYGPQDRMAGRKA